MPTALSATAINAVLTAAVLGPVAGGPWLWSWLGAQIGLTLARGVALHRLAGTETARYRVVLAGAAGSGVLWGLLTALPVELPQSHLLVVALVVAGMCAGATAVYAALFPIALAFIVPATLPLAARFVAEGSVPSLMVAMMVAVFAVGLLQVAWRFHRQFDKMFLLQARLARRTEELDETNARLRTEMADHQAAEAALRQAQKMEAVGQLTGGIAHDFNNMLAAIGGNLHLIRAAAGGREPIARYVAAAERAADRGAKLVSSLLSFGRRQGLRLEPVDVNALLQDFMPLLRRAAGTARFEAQLAEALPACVADGAHFQSAVLNLVLNARDATPADGRIVVATRRVELGRAELAGTEAEPGAFVALSVSDTGAGMEPEVREKAFEPFFTTKGPDKGSGLGLSQVYGFARQCGGHVAIESAPGMGTTVSIFLPVAARARAEARPAGASALAGEEGLSATILVVDDDVDVLEAVRRTLVGAGGEVIAARSGAEALPILRSDRPIGILCTDVVMPGLSGVELAREARALRPLLPVLLTSGYATDTLQAKGAMDGEFVLLSKPLRPAELTAHVRAALAGTAAE